MAQIDKLIEKMVERQISTAKLVGDRPGTAQIGQVEQVGPTISAAQLEQMVREIVSEQQEHQLSSFKPIALRYESWHGPYNIVVYRQNATLNVVVQKVNEDKKLCPFCAEAIQVEATKCRFCGEWLNVPPPVRAGEESKLLGRVRTLSLESLGTGQAAETSSDNVAPEQQSIQQPDKNETPAPVQSLSGVRLELPGGTVIVEPDEAAFRKALLQVTANDSFLYLRADNTLATVLITGDITIGYHADCYDDESNLLELGQLLTGDVIELFHRYWDGGVDAIARNNSLQTSTAAVQSSPQISTAASRSSAVGLSTSTMQPGAATYYLKTAHDKIPNPTPEECRAALDAMPKRNPTLSYSHSIALENKDGDEELSITKLRTDEYNVETTRNGITYVRRNITKEAVVADVAAIQRGKFNVSQWRRQDEPQVPATSGYAAPAHQANPSPPELTPGQIAGYQAQSCLGCMQMGLGCLGLIFFLFLAFVLLSTAR